MRFGFFFFADYVNVFIISALTVRCSSAAGLRRSHGPLSGRRPSINPGSLGIALLLIVLIVPLVLTLVFATPLWLISSRIKTWQALLGGFVLPNLFVIGIIFGVAYIGSLAWVAGPPPFMGKTYLFVFTFVWTRDPAPLRDYQLMNFAWKWLMELAFINILVTPASSSSSST